MPTQRAEAFGDLAREFARRAQHQHAGAAAGGRLGMGQKVMENRQSEGGGLAGAGLGDADEIAAGHDRGNGLRLNRRRLGVAELVQGKAKGRGEAESGEILQVEIFRIRPRPPRGRAKQAEMVWDALRGLGCRAECGQRINRRIEAYPSRNRAPSSTMSR